MKKLTPEQSRDLAMIGQTPLAQVYVEVLSPYWDSFMESYPEPNNRWFEKVCIESGDIAVRLKTDDPDVILFRLFQKIPGSVKAQIMSDLNQAPDNFVLNMELLINA